MEVHRFGNGPVETSDGLHWDAMGLFENVVTGLRKAVESVDHLQGIGIDWWAVDFGLLDSGGELDLGSAPLSRSEGRSWRCQSQTRHQR